MPTPQINIRNLNINVRLPNHPPSLSLAATTDHGPLVSGQTPSAERFELSADGTYVIDHKLGLLWPVDESEKEVTWADGKKYAEAFQIDGKPCRLPTQDELQSLRDLTKYNPCISAPFKSRSGWVWTSTDTPWSSGFVFCVYFSLGYVSQPPSRLRGLRAAGAFRVRQSVIGFWHS